MKLLKKTLTALLLGAAAHAVQAQANTDKVTRIIHGGASGGNADLVARMIAPLLTEQLGGQPLIVEAKPGAGQTIAMAAAAQAAADGHTMAMLNAGISVQNALNRKLPYKMTRDFTPVGMVSQFPFVVLVRSDSPLKTMDDLLRQARKDPGRLSYGTIGIGTSQHMVGELIGTMASVQLLHVPYPNAAGPLNDLLGGRLDAASESLTAANTHLQSGRLRALAVTSPQRWPSLPNVPALAETVPGFGVTSWIGLAVPAATPAAQVTQLERAVRQAVSSEKFGEQIRRLGSEPYLMNTADMKIYLEKEVAKWAELGSKAGINLE